MASSDNWSLRHQLVVALSPSIARAGCTSKPTSDEQGLLPLSAECPQHALSRRRVFGGIEDYPERESLKLDPLARGLLTLIITRSRVQALGPMPSPWEISQAAVRPAGPAAAGYPRSVAADSEMQIRTFAVLSNVGIDLSIMPSISVTVAGDPQLLGTIEAADPGKQTPIVSPRVGVLGHYPTEPGWLDSLIAGTKASPEPGDLFFPLAVYPDDLQSFVVQAGISQRASLRRFIELIRWRTFHQTWIGRSLRAYPTQEWSVDGAAWYPLPVNMSLTSTIPPTGAALTPDLQNSLNTLSAHDQREPLGWEIWHDALSARDRSDLRAAVILAISAVEIEVKRLIGELVPDAEWLVMNLQSPDVFKIIRDYLPLLPAVPSKLVPPKHLRTGLQDAITLRNQLIHVGGRPGVAREAVETEVANTCTDVLATASDLLLLFDAYRGHSWALAHLSTRTVEALGLSH